MPDPTPEQVIQAAFAQRSNRERDARLVQGFSARQVPLPVWAPEVAAAALRERGMLNVGGSPDVQGLSDGQAQRGLVTASPEPAASETHPSSCKGSCSARTEEQRWADEVASKLKDLSPEELEEAIAVDLDALLNGPEAGA